MTNSTNLTTSTTAAANSERSEVSIMIFSFITAFFIAMLVVTSIFMTVKKIEARWGNGGQVDYAVARN